MRNLLSKNWVINSIAIVLLAVFWQLSYTITNESLIFPSLWSVITAAYGVFQKEIFWETYYHTLITLVEAWALSILAVSITVSLCLLSKPVRAVFERYCAFFMPLPSFAMIPFVTLFFGLSKTTMLIVMVLSVYWFMSYQTLAAIDTVRLTWSKHIHNLRWGYWKTFIHVYLPAAAPTMFSLNSVAWTYIWRTLITLEIAYGAIGGYFGLGSYLIDVKNKLDVDVMYVILIVIAVTGVAINSLFNVLKELK
jgi:NitT/TauT family transport system permease protein